MRGLRGKFYPILDGQKIGLFLRVQSEEISEDVLPGQSLYGMTKESAHKEAVSQQKTDNKNPHPFRVISILNSMLDIDLNTKVKLFKPERVDFQICAAIFAEKLMPLASSIGYGKQLSKGKMAAPSSTFSKYLSEIKSLRAPATMAGLYSGLSDATVDVRVGLEAKSRRN